ncbi:GTP-binding protein Era [Anaerovibrio sp. JC8]|nr:GTP-binding protein Era [Anaerovibrio sp. JC8]
MDVIISLEPEDLQLEPEVEEIVRHAAEVTGPLYGVENGEVSITLTNNEYIHQLNNKYRGLDRPTDVLSFAFADSQDQEPEIEGGLETEILGDIIISVDKAKEQAKEYGHSLKRELSFLTVHGMLHLMGYDHMDEEERLEMEEEQRYVMNQLGITREGDDQDMQLPLAQAPDVVQSKGVEIDINSIPKNEPKKLPKDYKSGFVAVIGRPNVGKSTLINSLIGQKIAIMSDKPQTTRNRIMCVLTKPDVQMVFLDTPGIHKPIDKLGEYMVKAAEGTLQEVDAIIFVVDANEKFGPGEHYILERLKATKKPVVLAINKVDLLEDKEALLPIITNYNGKYDFAATVPISALEENNLEGLLEEVKKYLPKGPQYYPEDMVTDQPERLIIAEMVREKVLHLTRDEVPHSIAVDVDEMKVRDNGDNYVRVTIYVERDSQKGIIIGKKGAMLKEIGAQARQDVQMLLGGKVFLDLWVKVKKDWRNRDNILKGFGFE